MKIRDKLSIGTKIVASRLTGAPRPFFVQYGLLNACNARCTYCEIPSRPDHPLDLDVHLRMLDEYLALGAVRIKFLGGEPLLFKDLGRLVDHVNARGARTAMVTNGFLIPQQMDLIRRLDEVVISLDGDETHHDHHRGKGTWKRAMAGIEACHAAGVDFFLTAVVTDATVGEVDWLIALGRRLGVMVNFQVVQSNEAYYGPGAKTCLPGADPIRDTVAKIIAAKKDGAPVLFSVRSYEHTLNWRDFNLERVEKPGELSPCAAGKYFVHMDANTDVYPCFQHVGSFQAKNAARDGVEAAWKHAQKHSCFDCYNTWLNENKAIFDLRPEVLTNFWRNYMLPRTGAKG